MPKKKEPKCKIILYDEKADKYYVACDKDKKTFFGNDKRNATRYGYL